MQRPHSHRCAAPRPYHPHPSLSDSEKEMSGGNCAKTTELASYAALGFHASGADSSTSDHEFSFDILYIRDNALDEKVGPTICASAWGANEVASKSSTRTTH